MKVYIASRVLINRYGVYCFRLVIPKGMRLLFKQKEYRYSLKTKDKLTAKRLAINLGNLVENYFERIKITVKFEEAISLAQELINSLEIDTSEKHDEFLNNLLSASTGQDKARLLKLIDLRGQARNLHQTKLNILKELADNLCNASESEIDSLTCDFYAVMTPIKAEESKLAATYNQFMSEVQSLIHERLSENRIAEITDSFNKEKESISEFAYQMIAKAGAASNLNKDATKDSQELLSEVIKKYCANQIDEGKWNPKTVITVEAIFALWMRIVGDIPINTYTHQHHRDYKAKLLKLPPNINKSPQYRNKHIEEIFAMNCKPAASHTINKNLVSVSSFFEWAIRYGYASHNPAKQMTIKSPKRASEERKEFSDADLENLFNTTIYTDKNYKQPYQYWLPILALLTGARLNELCQLHLKDFETRDGIDLIRVTQEGGDKKIKTRAGERDIPIHPELKRLGILEYVETLKSKGEVRLFPELKMARDGYGQIASKWFARYRKSCGIVETGKVFHSFRHTFINKLKQLEIAKEKIAQLVGHEDDSETFGRYGKEFNIKSMYEVISTLKFKTLEGLIN